METEQIKEVCTKCGNNITELRYELLQGLTGYSIESLMNGGMKEVTATWNIGKIVLKSTGSKVINEDGANKIIKLALEELRRIQEPQITKEKIKEIEEKVKNQFWQQEQTLKELKDENRQYKKEIRELETRYNLTLDNINTNFGKLLNIPALKGASQEKMIAKTLSVFAPEDEITREKPTSEGEDVKAIIKENKQELAVVCIESKNNKSFKKEYLTQIRTYMEKNKTIHGILAVKVLPDTAQDDRLYQITEDGIWITSLDFLPFCYMAVRELIKKIKQIDMTKDKEGYLELLSRFRNIVDGKQYKDKIISIRRNIDSLRTSSDRLRGYSKNHCDTLDDIAKSIMGDIGSIEIMNKQALVSKETT